METAIAAILKTLSDLGLPGLIIGAMGYWIWTREQLVTTIQNARIDEGKEVIKSQMATAEALNKLTDALRNKGP